MTMIHLNGPATYIPLTPFEWSSLCVLLGSPSCQISEPQGKDHARRIRRLLIIDDGEFGLPIDHKTLSDIANFMCKGPIDVTS